MSAEIGAALPPSEGELLAVGHGLLGAVEQAVAFNRNNGVPNSWFWHFAAISEDGFFDEEERRMGDTIVVTRRPDQDATYEDTGRTATNVWNISAPWIGNADSVSHFYRFTFRPIIREVINIRRATMPMDLLDKTMLSREIEDAERILAGELDFDEGSFIHEETEALYAQVLEAQFSSEKSLVNRVQTLQLGQILKIARPISAEEVVSLARTR